MRNKKAQEEMVGFALILIIVAVLILVFLSISLRKPSQEVESYEIESFLQSLLYTTTDCSINYESNVQDVSHLIGSCLDFKYCLNEEFSCDVLNETLKNLVENSWPVGEDWPNKGYSLEIYGLEEELLTLSKGNLTGNSKGSSEVLQDFDISFEVYY